MASLLRDCRRILRNPLTVVVTLGVAMLPSLYAWFNILANWDPYSATGNLQVAVANEDQGTTNDLVGHLDAGRQVVKKLKQNDELGWRFVDNEEQAVQRRGGPADTMQPSCCPRISAPAWSNR